MQTDKSAERSRIMKIMEARIGQKKGLLPPTVNQCLQTKPQTLQIKCEQSIMSIQRVSHNYQGWKTQSLVFDKQEQLASIKKQFVQSQKRILQLQQQNQKKERELQYLRLQVSRSLISSKSQVSQENVDRSRQFKQSELHVKISNLKLDPPPKVSPLSAVYYGQNLRIDDSKAFCFQDCQ